MWREGETGGNRARITPGVAFRHLEPFRWNRNGAPDSCFDAFSSRQPVSTPHQVRGRLSLDNVPARRPVALPIWAEIGPPGTAGRRPSQELGTIEAGSKVEITVSGNAG